MFHLIVYVCSEKRHRCVTANEPSYAEIAKGAVVPDGTPHLRFKTRSDAFFYYTGSSKYYDEWCLHLIETCTCPDAIDFDPRVKVVPQGFVPTVVRTPQPVLTRAQRLAMETTENIG